MRSKQFKCHYNCGKIHEIPKEGFISNQALEKLLELKANDVWRGKKILELKSISNLIIKKTEQINLDLRIGDAKISKQCDKARNDLQLAIEEAHVKLDDIHKELMDKIDQHEKECQEGFKRIQQNKQDLESLLSESKIFTSKSDSLLRQHKINKFELKKTLSEACKLLDQLEKTSDKLECDMFKNKIVKFDRNKVDINAKSLGEIRFQE